MDRRASPAREHRRRGPARPQPLLVRPPRPHPPLGDPAHHPPDMERHPLRDVAAQVPRQCGEVARGRGAGGHPVHLLGRRRRRAVHADL